MHKITLELSGLMYEHIMHLLGHLPRGMVNITHETPKPTTPKKHKPISLVEKFHSLKGKGKELYTGIDSDAYIKELRHER